MDTASYFSADYAQARRLFRELAETSSATLDRYVVPGSGPGGLELSTDIAWFGPAAPRKALVVQSGVHGVEAFAGAAVQCGLVAQDQWISSDTALVVIHVLNPYGMAWLRRVNASNVDLNRNCLMADEAYAGVAAAYRKLDALINPKSPPRRDFFIFRALLRILRYGIQPLKQAVAMGQYAYPKGLFYGGTSLEPEARMLRRWLAHNLSGIKSVMVVDLHTGLGRFGQCRAFPALSLDTPTKTELAALLDESLVADQAGGEGYAIKGAVANLYVQVFADIRPVYLTVEFGTQPLLRVLRALREENRCHFYEGGDLRHPAKNRLKQALCPGSPTWRAGVAQAGGTLVTRLFRCLDAAAP